MKWYVYVICVVLIAVGVFFGIRLYQEVTNKSYVNGSIDITNEFSKESFEYSSNSVVFYHDLYDDSDTYTFENDLLKVVDFDGEKKTYEVYLNDKILLDSEFEAGSVFSKLNIDFCDTNGELIRSSPIQISIEFLSNKTKLSISTIGQDNVSFLEQYFKDNGIRLKVVEIL